MIILSILIALNIISTWAVIWLLFKRVTKKESEFYTDYIHGKLILRVFKAEFEYQAIGNVTREKLLDVGNLNAIYKWALLS